MAPAATWAAWTGSTDGVAAEAFCSTLAKIAAAKKPAPVRLAVRKEDGVFMVSPFGFWPLQGLTLAR